MTDQPRGKRVGEPAPETERVSSVLDQLTLGEKIHLLHGDMHSGGVERLGIPKLVCSDGPVGIRLAGATSAILSPNDDEVQIQGLVETDFAATAFPATLALAATFNTAAAAEFGRTLGREARAAGIQVMFGPGINLMRDPRCGRNFEYMGEDPLLVGDIASAYIRGMQGEGVGACAKHFYANDAEHPRHYMSSNLDRRTAWEMHLAPFIAACEAGVWSIMTGNNLVNGRHISENPDELKGILRDHLHWDGVIFTDWRAAYTPLASIQSGQTMTTGFCSYVFGDGRLLDYVRDGAVPQSEIDDRVRDVLTLYERTGLLADSPAEAQTFDAAAHRHTARRLARDGMVLLTNDDDVLPLSASIKTLVITGPAADCVVAGTGSSKVVADSSAVTPRAGLAAAFADAKVICEDNPTQAEALADSADAVIYFAQGPSCGEGRDLDSIRLPDNQGSEIAALADAAERVIVVVQCGTAVDMSAWIDNVAAVLIGWYGGQMVGAAIADILSGATSPSGKLPFTLGRTVDDYPCARLGLWPAKLLLDQAPPRPGYKPEARKVLHAYDADYDEGVFIGYRWFQREQITPLFPFGFGLSYTTFEVSDLRVDSAAESIQVTCTVANIGARDGAEVVQVYVEPPTGQVPRPVRELKGFAKVRLAPGEKTDVCVDLPANALAYYDESSHQWKAPAGSYQIQIAASCEDVRLQEQVDLPEDRFYPLV